MISVLRSFCILLSLLAFGLVSCRKDNFSPAKVMPENADTFSQIESPAESLDTTWQPSFSDTTVTEDTMTLSSSQDEGLKNFAYGNLTFGMSPQEVKEANAGKQKLADYHYNFTYRYNNRKQLYAIYLYSEPEKVIYYETRLQDKYSNLCRIIAEKYGHKNKCVTLPSIFEVMNSQTLYLSKWQTADKKIQLGIQQDQLDAYRVVCKISHPAMEEVAKKEKYNRDNKKWIDASEKF